MLERQTEIIPFGPRPVLERGAHSPYAYVEYETEAGHTHMVMVGDGKYNGIADGASFEDLAIELADQVEDCNQDKHEGHGREHGSSEPKKAFSAALNQLLTKDYDNEWATREWRIKMYKKWGNRHMPTAVLMPSAEDYRKYELMVAEHKGDPHFYDVPSHRVNDLLPPPQEGGAEKAELGWKVDQRKASGPLRRKMNRAERRRRDQNAS